jgi:hypothetical protein
MQRLLGGFTAAAFTGGHTHLQQLRRVGDGLFFNPGSIGRAFARHQAKEQFRYDPWAEYAVLSLAEHGLRVEFRRVPLGVGALAQIILRSGVPYAEKTAAQYHT